MKQPGQAQKLLENIHGFVDDVSAGIELDLDPERAICKARWLAKFLEVNYCGIYRLDRIEEALAQKLEHLAPTSQIANPGYLFIASEVYAYGGHTQLLRNLFSACEEPKGICITRAQPARSVLSILKADRHQIKFVLGQSETQRISHLAQLIASYETVLLIIHPDDINCAVAARLAKLANPGVRIGFVNHSDHTFSVGVGLADVVFEISGLGWALRDMRGTLATSSFMGVPIPSMHMQHMLKEAVALTGGSWYKYKPSQGRSIVPYLRALLKQRTEITLHVVGPNLWVNPWWWGLKLAHPLRLRISPMQAKDKYIELLQKAQIYIDSYPVTGGVAFSESVAYGCLPVGLKIPIMGYSAMDAYRVNSIQDFLTYIDEKTKTVKKTEEWIELLQESVAAAHKPEVCFERVRLGMSDEGTVPLADNRLNVGDIEFLNRNWLTNGRVIMPTILAMNCNIQLKLIKEFTELTKNNFVYRNWLLMRSRLVRIWFWRIN